MGPSVHQALLLINTQIKAAHRIAKSANLAVGTADIAAGTTKSPGIPLPLGQQLLAPSRKKRKVSSIQSVPTEGDSDHSDDNVTTQEIDIDPHGGEF